MDGAEGGAGQVGADEDALDVDGAAFELGGLEGDDDRGAVLFGGGGAVSWPAHLLFRGEKEKSNGVDFSAAKGVGGGELNKKPPKVRAGGYMMERCWNLHLRPRGHG